MSKLNKLEQDLSNYFYQLNSLKNQKRKEIDKLQAEISILDDTMIEIESMLAKEEIKRKFEKFEKFERVQGVVKDD